MFHHTRKGNLILLVGEGNFSFGASLLKSNCVTDDDGSSYYFTSFESSPECLAKYGKEITENLDFLELHGAHILHGVDATKLEQTFPQSDVFDCIIFQFPHTGRKASIKKNRELLKLFFISASSIMNQENGSIIVTLCAGQGGTEADLCRREHCNSWQIVEMATSAHLILVDVDTFNSNNFPEYTPTGRRNAGNCFVTQKAMSHKFQYAGCIPPLQTDWCSNFIECKEKENFCRIDASYFNKRIELCKAGTLSQIWLTKKLLRRIYSENACNPLVARKDLCSEVCENHHSYLYKCDSGSAYTQCLRQSLTVHLASLCKEALAHKGKTIICHGPIFSRVQMEDISKVSPIRYQVMIVSTSSEQSQIMRSIEDFFHCYADQEVCMLIQEESDGSDLIYKTKDRFWDTHELLEQNSSNLFVATTSTQVKKLVGLQHQIMLKEANGKLTPFTLTLLDMDNVAAALNCGINENPLAIWSLNARTRDRTTEALQTKVKYIPMSLYPPKYPHCFSFWIEDTKDEMKKKLEFTQENLIDLLQTTTDHSLMSLELVEEYQKDCLSKTSLCYQATYQSPDYSLSRKECSILQDKVRFNISKYLNVTLR